MLNSVSLRGVKCIGRVFLLEHDMVIINDEASPTAVQAFQVHRYQAAKGYLVLSGLVKRSWPELSRTRLVLSSSS